MAAAGVMRRSGARTSMLQLVSLFLFLFLAAVVATAAGDVDGGGAGGGEDRESSLELWPDGGGDHLGETEDFFNWDEEEEEDNDDEEDDPHIVMVGSDRGTRGRPPTGKHVVNVESFGAAGDGYADDTQAFLDAWKKACSLENAVFLVPGGRRYKVGATRFMGPCKHKMMIQIQGTIVAPEEPSQWDPRSPRLWLLFGGLVGAHIEGGGVIDGSGSKWWANSCKIDKSKPCKGAPTAVTLDSCRGVRMRRLRIQNAQQMHLTVSRSRNVRVAGLHIESPEDSPNTDGIHVAESTGVSIQSCRIGTGDDCVSISNASFNVHMRNIECGPGHGISIGSLGQGGSRAAVANVALDTAVIRSAQNGVRIKTWQGGSGYVRNVRFENVRVERVGHPIVIDQFYCDSRTPCANSSSSGVQVSSVAYRGVSGTSTRAEAIRLACSGAAPCRGIVLQDVDLRRADTGGEVQAVCSSASGMIQGGVRPNVDCLTRRTATALDHEDDGGGQGEDDEAVVRHTEL